MPKSVKKFTPNREHLALTYTMSDDNNWMSLAVDLAARARDDGNLPAPNPAVGCVLVSVDGTVIGRGHTQHAGGPHAEIQAIQDARRNGTPTAGATAYVTLEPCCHHGRTGPCCEALIEAGVTRVVASSPDPNPQVSGRGFSRLRAAGIEVDVGRAAEAASALNIGFFSRMMRKTPWVRMKIAASLDGRTALADGRSQWITEEAARIDGHSWRARACVVLTGIGTVLDDDPMLDVRHGPTRRQPHLVVVDSRLQTPTSARLFNNVDRRIYIYCAVEDDVKAGALKAKGATVICLPQRAGTAGNSGSGSDISKAKVNLSAMFADLAQREVNEVHVEAGERLNGSLLREGLVDDLLLYLAPKLIGVGRNMANFGPLHHLEDALALTVQQAIMVGADLRVLARVASSEEFVRRAAHLTENQDF